MTPCPDCNGKCCCNEFGYEVEHMDAECYFHQCESCLDGKASPPSIDDALQKLQAECEALRTRAEKAEAALVEARKRCEDLESTVDFWQNWAD
jgi:hypothetical protein